MTNYEKYKAAFAEAFEADPDVVESFEFLKAEGWDSIGHMALIALLEQSFDIEFSPEEILSITSFNAGKELLSQKGISFN